MFWYQNTRLLRGIVQRSLHLSPVISQTHNPVLNELMKEFTDVSYVADVVNKEDVKHLDYKDWKSRIALFKNYGFEDRDCFKMISLYPSLLKIPETNLQLSLQQWINAELGTTNFQLILTKCPHLLEVNDNVIRKRIPILRTYFRSVSGLSQLIINSPNVIYEDWNQLHSKMNYLITEKRFKMGDILKSCALSKDLDFIRLRFYVAEKCGVYKQQYLMPHEERKHKKFTFQNPELKFILQNKDENFAKFVAKITLEEYLAAKELFLNENTNNSLDEDADSDSGDDDDDDEDDDEYLK